MESTRRTMLFLFAGFALTLVQVLAGVSVSRGHDAPTGCSYGFECCSSIDCGPVPADWIREGPDGLTIIPTGETLPYTDRRIKQSKDDATHWCRPPNDPNPRTICVYLPARSF